GTFISIALSMPNFSSSDTAALEQEIALLLSGVGTAFYVSIYGIFLALWWMFFEKFGKSKIERLLNRQKNSTSGFFW
ncbi:MotA/TolQ/ExbB proton channel family protein, partial [Campylobacter jejuni]